MMVEMKKNETRQVNFINQAVPEYAYLSEADNSPFRFTKEVEGKVEAVLDPFSKQAISDFDINHPEQHAKSVKIIKFIEAALKNAMKGESLSEGMVANYSDFNNEYLYKEMVRNVRSNILDLLPFLDKYKNEEYDDRRYEMVELGRDANRLISRMSSMFKEHETDVGMKDEVKDCDDIEELLIIALDPLLYAPKLVLFCAFLQSDHVHF